MIQPLLHRLGIGPHQAAGAEQCATKISGHYHRNIADTGSGQYFQHRTPRRSGGFPVIAAPGQFASASYYKCRTVVSGIPVFFLHFFYKSHCFFLGFTLADRRDKAGLFLHDFAFPAGQKDSIVICCCHVTHVWPHLFLNSYFLLLSFSV